ncbi:MAG TPA: hypothetical protein VGB96_21620, partial [Archangium sp.]
ELVRVGEALAFAGEEAALLPVLEQLRAMRPFDADALLARLRYQQQRLPEAAEALERAFATLRETPWHNRSLFQSTMGMVVHLSTRDEALGQRMWSALEKPFSNYAGESLRVGARLDLGTRLDSGKRCAEALVPFEPHVPWTQQFLELRSRCYVTTNHPLQDQALGDLVEFMQGEPPPLWGDGPGATGPQQPPAAESEKDAPPVSDVGTP